MLGMKRAIPVSPFVILLPLACSSTPSEPAPPLVVASITTLHDTASGFVVPGLVQIGTPFTVSFSTYDINGNCDGFEPDHVDVQISGNTADITAWDRPSSRPHACVVLSVPRSASVIFPFGKASPSGSAAIVLHGPTTTYTKQVSTIP